MRRALPFVLLLVGPAASCIGPGLQPPAGAELDLALEVAPPLSELPEFVTDSDDDWVRLDSGEWLRGEIEVLTHGTLELDSEELDSLSLDFDDVARVHSSRRFVVVLDNRASVAGVLAVDGDVVIVQTDDGPIAFPREEVQRIVVESGDERSLWSGNVDLGLVLQRGNTDQTDTTLGLAALRRTPVTRLTLAFDSVESEQAGSKVASSQRFEGRFDVFVTSRLFLTPFGLELFRDRFQNIDLRATPSTGLGYVFVEDDGVEWSGTAGVGYRWTRFDSVVAGQDREEGEGVGLLGTELSADLTEKLDLDASYAAQLSFEGLEKTQQSAEVMLTYDLWGNLDAKLGAKWTRIGDPEPDANGVTPEEDDFRVTAGLSWSF